MIADLEWSCHVCGRVRPDAKISVRKVQGTFGPGGRFEIGSNVRYCNDEAACTDAAQLVGEEGLRDIGATVTRAAE